MTSLPADKQSLVIIGGGFAGATLARRAERLLDRSTDVVVISRDNHMVFTPMLPEVAGRSVSVANIAVPGRSTTKRTTWIEAIVTSIDESSRKIGYRRRNGTTSEVTYSHLVVACGSEATLESIPGLNAYALTVKTAGDALQLGNEVIARFEEADSEPDPAKREALLHAVVIGGGFSGVEVAGQLNDLMTKLLPSYKGLQDTKPRVTVLQQGSKVLPEFSHESLSDFTLRKMRDSGIEVQLKTSAVEVADWSVILESGERIRSRLIVCTIGTHASLLVTNLGLKLEKGRIVTEEDMRVAGRSNLWAIGDCAVIKNAFDGKPSPPTAQFALRQAAQLAQNIRLVMDGKSTKPFRFRPQGLLASIGRGNGVAEVFGFKFSGFIAWMLWRGVYLLKIPSLSSKLGVALDWLTSAFFPPSMAQINLPGLALPQRAHYAKDDLVFESSSAPDKAIFIESGCARLHLGDSDHVVALLKKGDYFGGAAFGNSQSPSPHHPTVRVMADTPLDVMEVDEQSVAHFAEAFSPLKATLAEASKVRSILARLLWDQSQDRDLAELKVGQVLDTNIPLMDCRLQIGEALHTFAAAESGYWVVDGNRKLIGYLGRIELYEGLANHPPESPISDAVRETPAPVSVDQDLFSATVCLLRSQLHKIPVVDTDGRILGLYDLLHLIRRLEPAASPASTSNYVAQ